MLSLYYDPIYTEGLDPSVRFPREEIKDTHRLWRADLIEQHNDDRCSPFRAEFIRPRFLWVS